MSTTAATTATPTVSKSFNLAVVSGRVDSMRTFETDKGRGYALRLIQPSDGFSSPGFLEVESERQFGFSVGQDVEIKVKITGYRNDFVSPKTGEHFKSARIKLVAI